jgi:hypothetical protein
VQWAREGIEDIIHIFPTEENVGPLENLGHLCLHCKGMAQVIEIKLNSMV